VAHLDTRQQVTAAEVAEMLRLVDDVETATGHPALPDQSRLILQQGGGDCFATVIERQHGELVAFAQLSPTNESWALDVVVAPNERGAAVAIGDLVATALDALVSGGNTPADVTWWRSDHHHHPDEAGHDGPGHDHPHGDRHHLTHNQSLDSTVHLDLGFVLDRKLLQLRRPLPTGQPIVIETRSFVPGRDERAFLDVNNRAFADHAEQGGWTIESMKLREAEPWFDPTGFRLLEYDGRLAGFCWTKVHPPSPAERHHHHANGLGEIYVIAVDPDFAGQGLGSQLTLAGLDHLSGLGITEAMLYVDADNRGAVSVYERLGFTIHSSSGAFVLHLDASGDAHHHHPPHARSDETEPTR
jgi:mycothiol synthase